MQRRLGPGFPLESCWKDSQLLGNQRQVDSSQVCWLGLSVVPFDQQELLPLSALLSKLGAVRHLFCGPKSSTELSTETDNYTFLRTMCKAVVVVQETEKRIPELMRFK